MMTANYLVNNFGFKRKTKNKQKLLVNDGYGIILKNLDNYTNYFIDINTSEKYCSICDIITKFELEEIKKASKRFHEGLPKQNLRQGDFNNVYKKNNQKEEFFISHNKAKKLLEAQFNRHICNPLMFSSSIPNYNYYIKETKYEFRKNDSKIVTLTLYYNYKHRKGDHDFWMSHKIYNFDKDNFPVNRRVGANIPLDLIIEKFMEPIAPLLLT